MANRNVENMWEAFDTKIMFYSHANNNRYEYKKQILISTTKELLHLVSFQNLKGRLFKGRLT